MDAAELLVYLETMRDKGKPLHKYIIRIEVGDSYYDSDIEEQWQVSEEKSPQDNPRLVFRGKR